MSTPAQLASLEGQQYLVLRPGGIVADTYRAVQAQALDDVHDTVTHPHTGHVTLRGLYEPERRHLLRDLIREWAADQHPIELTAEAVDVFPAPWQIVILRLARTPALVNAYASLTTALDATDFRRLGELSLEEWTFHLSVVYGRHLDDGAWSELERASLRDLPAGVTETVSEVEFVWYENGAEHSEVIPLG
ncbi:2'-5' RNA ligase family protein [Microbacterium sp. M28]|uniref:2'-5' RNA ligase family protein n=1 Tax=Microbacterium sp. M28 TaxID=2962064 RepID=UPI0021F3EF3F|nr:2'-5' RNA ligase family protein [Microbacterium sp. M28]UYO96427.1 2'-5' RNA ligase family protein [Microbacterium sp. M28]